MTNSVAAYLEENGPTAIPELPRRPKLSDRHRYGVTVFKNRTNSPGSNISGSTVNVAYLFDKHTRQEVYEAYLEANPRVLEQSRNAIGHHLRPGRKHRDALEAAIEEVCND